MDTDLPISDAAPVEAVSTHTLVAEPLPAPAELGLPLEGNSIYMILMAIITILGSGKGWQLIRAQDAKHGENVAAISELNARIDQLESKLRAEARDGDGRDDQIHALRAAVDQKIAESTQTMLITVNNMITSALAAQVPPEPAAKKSTTKKKTS